MSRKTLLLALSLVLVVGGGGGAALVLLIRHEPAIYRSAAVPPGPTRLQRSDEFVEEFSQLISSAVTPVPERVLDIRLTDEQINSYFAEGFKQSRLDERLLPENIREPRVVLEPSKLCLAFRYGSGLWSSVVTIEFGVWLTEEPNVVALRLIALRAGSLPINAQYVLDNLTQLAENNNIQVSWYRFDGDPVALLRFQGEQRDASVQLDLIQIDKGSIAIRGRPVDASLRSAAIETRKPVGN